MGSSSQTIGYWYHLATHHGLCKGPIDAFLEYRGGTKTAWSGSITASATLGINAEELWGGEKDQGGIVGPLNVMFGEAGQMPNSYLQSVFGDQTAAWRGLTTVAFEGGKYGAMNPYPQKPSYKIRSITKQWDDGDCWYEPTAPVPLEESGSGGPGVPSGTAYRWAFTMAGANKLSPSINGSDWTDPTTLTAPYASSSTLVQAGEHIVGVHKGGTSKYALWTAPGAWINGPNIGTSSGLEPFSSFIDGVIWVARGSHGFSYSSDPTASYTQVADQTALIAGNADYVVRFTGSSAYKFIRTQDKGGTWIDGISLVISGSSSDANYSYFFSGAAASETRIAFAGGNHHEELVIFFSDDGFATYSSATTPAGLSGSVYELMYLGGNEWLAFYTGIGVYDAGVLRSTNNCASFTSVDFGVGIGMTRRFQGNAGYDRRDGRLVAFFRTEVGERIYQTDDRITWNQRAFVAPFPPTQIICFAEYISGEGGVYSGRYAMNPAHMLVYAHTQRDTGRQPLETVNLPNAVAAADWFYAQGFGLCTVRRPEAESPAEFMRRIEKVSACSFSRSLADGLYYIDIANGEYDFGSLPILTDADVVAFKEIPTVLDSAINSVSIKYFDPQRKESIITPPLRALGLIAEFGVNHQTYDYPEIPTGEIAVRVAHRELLASCTPTRAFDLATTRKPYGWRQSTYFRLQLPKRGITDMVCLLGELQHGQLRSGALKIKAVQDVYSLPSTVYTEVEHGSDPRPPQTPVVIVDQRAIEAPYMTAVAAMTPAEFSVLDADVGFALGIASDPGRSRDFTMMVAPGGGAYVKKDDGDFCPTAIVSSIIEPGNKTGIPIVDGVRLQEVQIGEAVLWDDEICRVDAIDIAGGTIDLGRACADTVPQRHLAGSRLFFADDRGAADPTQYSEGEDIEVKLLTNTGSKQLSQALAVAMPLTFVRRIDRPYPQGNLLLNGLPFYTSGAIAPGGGGGGGGGGSGTPTSPPATGPNGAPASDTPGPGGGYPDDAPYPIPQPTVFGTDTIPGGGTFDDPDDVLAWRKHDGSALPDTWESGDGALQFTGFSIAEAYCYAVRVSFPVMPGTKYVATFKATLETPPGVTAVIGIGRGFNSQGTAPADVAASTSVPQEYPVSTEVEVTFEYFVTEAQNFGANAYVTANAMPFVRFTPSTGYAYIGKLSLADFIMEAFPPTMIAASPTNADLSAGLTGVTQYPVVAGTPTVVLSGGQLKATTTTEFGQHQYFIWDDPISGVTDLGQIIEISGKTFSNSVAVQSGMTVMGTAIGVATKMPGGDYVPYFRSLFHRGDMTLRKFAMRVPVDPPLGATYHMFALTKAELGKTSGFSDMSAAVSDAVVIP